MKYAPLIGRTFMGKVGTYQTREALVYFDAEYREWEVDFYQDNGQKAHTTYFVQEETHGTLAEGIAYGAAHCWHHYGSLPK